MVRNWRQRSEDSLHMSNDSNAVCDSVNCFAPAVKEIKVKVGEEGSIRLLLCESCQFKFLQGDNTE